MTIYLISTFCWGVSMHQIELHDFIAPAPSPAAYAETLMVYDNGPYPITPIACNQGEE
jgi:hypothetical protein